MIITSGVYFVTDKIDSDGHYHNFVIVVIIIVITVVINDTF